MFSETILVTGAPRSGTTPLGHILSKLPGALEIYEPMGPTGDKSITSRFPIPGESGFSQRKFSDFIERMNSLELNFKSQRRPAHSFLRAFGAKLFGTRTLQTYRRAKFSQNRELLVWKDPHAIFCASFAGACGFRSVVTVRPPLAHAASFKRLRWLPPLDDIYTRYKQTFGALPVVEQHISSLKCDPVGASALLWHMIHASILKSLVGPAKDSLYLFNMAEAEKDELKAYRELLAWLGRPFTDEIANMIKDRANIDSNGAVPEKNKVHDFNRTAAQANNYWSSVLDDKEIELVLNINGEIWDKISAA